MRSAIIPCMTKQEKIALMQQMLLDAPKSAVPMIRSWEGRDLPELRLSDEEWEGLLDWLDEVHPGD